jgi:hypothetical protein
MTVSLAPLLAGGEARAFDIGLSFNLFASYQFVPAPLEQTPLQGVGVLVRELEDGDEQICTGIQLNSRIVLTAAHCVVSRQGEIVSPGGALFLSWATRQRFLRGESLGGAQRGGTNPSPLTLNGARTLLY